MLHAGILFAPDGWQLTCMFARFQEIDGFWNLWSAVRVFIDEALLRALCVKSLQARRRQNALRSAA